jgi:hypothetical protein
MCRDNETFKNVTSQCDVMPPRKVGRGKVVTTVVREPIYSILEQLAKDLGFPHTSALLNWIIRDWLERRGILTPAPKPPARPPVGGREGVFNGQGRGTRPDEGQLQHLQAASAAGVGADG